MSIRSMNTSYQGKIAVNTGLKGNKQAADADAESSESTTYLELSHESIETRINQTRQAVRYSHIYDRTWSGAMMLYKTWAVSNHLVKQQHVAREEGEECRRGRTTST